MVTFGPTPWLHYLRYENCFQISILNFKNCLEYFPIFYRKIEDVKAELDNLKATEDALETKLESRKKQFHVLVQSIHNLQALLDEDNDISFHSSRMKEDANESIEDGIMDTS